MIRTLARLGTILAALALVACTAETPLTNILDPAQSTGPTTMPTAQATATPIPMTTYIDPELGIALDYPATWHVQATPGWLVVITSFDPEASQGHGGIAPDQTKIDLVPSKTSEEGTLDELAAEVRAGEAAILAEERWTLTDGVPAIRMQLFSEAAGEMVLLLTVIDGHSLRLAGYGDLALFDTIARTLRASSSGAQ